MTSNFPNSPSLNDFSLQEVVDGSGMEQRGREYLILVPKVFRVLQEQLVLKALLEPKVLQVLRVQLLHKELKVLLVQLVHKVHRV